jgi:hypothetical protein
MQARRVTGVQTIHGVSRNECVTMSVCVSVCDYVCVFVIVCV